MNPFSKRAMARALVFSLAISGFPAFAADGETGGETPGTATLSGRIFEADKVTPIAGAVVRAVRGDGAQVYSSLPTDEKGNYDLNFLPPGTYDLVVELPDGVFIVDRTLSIPEAKAYELSLSTVVSESVEKTVPTIEKPVLGYAWTQEGKDDKGGGFWTTPGGIAVIAGGLIGAGFALSGSSSSSNGSSSAP